MMVDTADVHRMVSLSLADMLSAKLLPCLVEPRRCPLLEKSWTATQLKHAAVFTDFVGLFDDDDDDKQEVQRKHDQ